MNSIEKVREPAERTDTELCLLFLAWPLGESPVAENSDQSESDEIEKTVHETKASPGDLAQHDFSAGSCNWKREVLLKLEQRAPQCRVQATKFKACVSADRVPSIVGCVDGLRVSRGAEGG